MINHEAHGTYSRLQIGGLQIADCNSTGMRKNHMVLAQRICKLL
jgi:hypothetical protein